MADPFVAEIRIFPFNFAPKGWAWCNGQLMPISQNTALFSLLGTTYGGDGKSTFALPDMRGNAPIHAGQGPGLSLYDLGQMGGSETLTLLQSEMPAHSHALRGHTADPGDNNQPGPTLSLAKSNNGQAYQTSAAGTLCEPQLADFDQSQRNLPGRAPQGKNVANVGPEITVRENREVR
jgi:microcystin-dependent protein